MSWLCLKLLKRRQEDESSTEILSFYDCIPKWMIMAKLDKQKKWHLCVHGPSLNYC